MSHFEFRCNRCETFATDSSRGVMEAFTAHHMATVHPLYTKETTRTLWTPKPKRRRFRSASASHRIAS